MSGESALFPSRSAAGVVIGAKVQGIIRPPALVWGMIPDGVEPAAEVARTLGVPFDVVAVQNFLVDGRIVGAIAEDEAAVHDDTFEVKFGAVDAFGEAVDAARSDLRRDRILYRGHRALRRVDGHAVIIVGGQWIHVFGVMAVSKLARSLGATRLTAAAAAATAPVVDRLRVQGLQVIVPHVSREPEGFANPFGDEVGVSGPARLRGVVVARSAAAVS